MIASERSLSTPDCEAIATFVAAMPIGSGAWNVVGVEHGWLALRRDDEEKRPHLFIDRASGLLLEFPDDVHVIDIITRYDHVRDSGRCIGKTLRTLP